VLAIEQLTGVVRPPATVISAGGASATYADPEALLAALKTAQEDSDAAETEKVNAQKAYDDLNTNDACKTAKPDPSNKDNQTKYEQCEQARVRLERAKTAAANAAERLSYYRSTAERLATGFTASAGIGASFSTREAEKGADPASLEEVAEAVRLIVHETFEFNEIVMTCVVRLRNMTDDEWSKLANVVADASKSPSRQLDEACIKLVEEGAYLEAAEMKKRAAALSR
jgi:hypothetical protein